MAPEIREFFDQSALHLFDSAVHEWFRLMLIHYPDGPVPTEWDSELWTDTARTQPMSSSSAWRRRCGSGRPPMIASC